MVADFNRTDRQAAARAAGRYDGKLWPNSLGFDRSGWEYHCLNGQWTALYRRTGLYGEGATPNLARAAATEVTGAN